jgi:hypothetical protein
MRVERSAIMDAGVPEALADFVGANSEYLADEPDVADYLSTTPEKASFLIAEARRDADCMFAFLHRLVGRSPEGELLEDFHLPIERWHDLLLNLAVAIRLCRWEQAGLALHLRAELPTAYTAIAMALASRTRPDAFPEAWRERVSLLARSRFVWAARDLLSTVVAFEETEEDELAQVLAQFAWAHRNDLIQEIPTEGSPCGPDPKSDAHFSTPATAAAGTSKARRHTSPGHRGGRKKKA